MTSQTFRHVLRQTGYLGSSSQPAPGLTLADGQETARLRAVFENERVGLNADAVFSAQNVPTTIFKDAADTLPSDKDIRHWHEAAWNIGAAPLLWVVTPTDVRLYDCYASPRQSGPHASAVPPALDRFVIDSEERLRALDGACGRLATETGAFWSSSIGAKIDRRHRVDRELLAEINALEMRLIDLTPRTASPHARVLARDLAQRFIGRCIFTWYLLDRGLAQPFLPVDIPADLSAMFGTPETTLSLFSWLRTTFNGDLFPMDDPGAEREHLTVKHLTYIRDFIEGRSLIPGMEGQGRLFRFRFNAIPIDLISSIYQQFARSSGTEETESQGLHYTPVELVHLTLDPVFEALPTAARVIDPTCGSGAFLVEALRRLVWRATGGKPAMRKLVRTILYNQIYGVDINRSALGIAAFSLYLAALELDDEPLKDIDDLKFHHLINKTLFEQNSLAETLPKALTAKSFDAVVGNPPWTFIPNHPGLSTRVIADQRTLRPRRSPDQAFLRRAAELAGESGRIGMIMKASPFFSKDIHAVQARNELLKRLSPVALINLSHLRREELFPDVSGPALLFFSRCALATNPDRILVGSCPWSADFRRTGVFQIGPGEIRSVPLSRILDVPPLLKAATFGTVRDGWLIRRLEKEFPTLDEALTAIGIERRIRRGQGFIVKGARQAKSPDRYFRLPLVVPRDFAAFRLTSGQLTTFDHETLHRVRVPSLFDGPVLLCPKSPSGAATQRGRYRAAVSSVNVLYSQSFFGVSFVASEPRFAYLLAAILNSSVAVLQFAFGGPTWGLERPTVAPHDLLSLRIPFLHSIESGLVHAVLEVEKRAASAPHNPTVLAALDEAVFDLYDLEPEERILATDSVDRARELIFQNRKERDELARPPDTVDLVEYAGQVVCTVNAYLRTQDTRHIEALIYREGLAEADLLAGIPGVTAVRLVLAAGGPGPKPVVRIGDRTDIEALAAMLQGRLETEIPPYLNERRQLRVYGDEDLFILKPRESRYWTRTAGLNDADTILADHWARRPGAVA